MIRKQLATTCQDCSGLFHAESISTTVHYNASDSLERGEGHMPSDTDRVWYSINKTARKLGISRNTMYVWIAAGKGPAVHRIGGAWKFEHADVEAYLKSTRKQNESVA